jgi:YVTN family beta-propeller protein
MRSRSQSAHALLAAACLLACSAASADTTTILQQSFSSGLGNFTSAGAVATSSAGAVLTGSTFGTDGAITSRAFSTQGMSSVTVSYTRSTTGMAQIPFDKGIVEYSVNGGAYKQLESTRVTTATSTSFTLPATALNSTVTLRFRVSALLASEKFTVNNVTVTANSGGSTGGGGGGTIGSAPAIGEFVTFESGHVRPMALSPDGTRLYVVNTPDARVEVFDVTGSSPSMVQSIPVGLEPVAVAFAPNGQLWVVNHLSDSVSIVDVSSSPAKVVNTLQTADEPRDIVFAGPNNRWAFITAAHRGQNAPFDPNFNDSKQGRSDVWVFDATNPGSQMGGKPATVLSGFGDTTRALARNADGTRVYFAGLNTGNRTTVIQGGPSLRLAKAEPNKSVEGVNAPPTGLIVQKQADGTWKDSGDPKRGIPQKDWSANVKMNLPDNDVFVVDTTTSVPTLTKSIQTVGTTLFNMAVNPVNGKVYVTNQDARNVVRFEGPGTTGTTVNGHFVEARISVVDGNTGNVQARHLNKHITSYDQPLGTAAEKAAAVATPMEMAITPDGKTMYMVSMGTNKLVRYNTADIENDSFTPSPANQLVLQAGLPTGVVLDAARNRAFVTTRLDNGLSVVNLSNFTETAHVKMNTPEPAEVVAGRKFLYDAAYTSSRGDSSCAGCHIFGDMDHLDWDLGNPDDEEARNGNPYNPVVPIFLRQTTKFHPMKGPMNTQTFRGMQDTGPLHWRGDRQGKSTGKDLSEKAFKDFSVAFPGLLGRENTLTDAEMTAFSRFVMKITYPPNPVQPLDNTYTEKQQAGFNFYMRTNADTIATCNGCHRLDKAKNQYGTDGTMSFEGPTIAENIKIAQLRNMYTKVGSFTDNNPQAPFTGDQIRGFGYSNEGSKGNISEFLNALVFIGVNKTNRDLLQEFVLAFPSNLDPIVGQQLTVTPTNGSQSDVTARLALLTTRAEVTSPRPECELVAKAVVNGAQRGWVYDRGNKSFVSDKSGETPIGQSALLSLAKSSNAPVTFTCAPPGNGTRLGISRLANGRTDN